MKANKNLLIDAITGKSFSSPEHAERMVKDGLATFTGNQWNPDWDWSRSKLEALSESELKDIYINGGNDEPVIRNGEPEICSMREAASHILRGGSIDLRKAAMRTASKGYGQALDNEMVSILSGGENIE